MIQKYKFFLTGLVLTIALLWPLLPPSFFKHHDDVQIIRLYEMDKCFKDGQIPCRWVPDLGGLYGYPLFNYYAPLPYYFGELIFLITKSLIISVKIMFAMTFLGAYVFMYLFAKKYWGNLGGTISGVFYSFAPYHAVDFYVRGAMGEMWALMLFPAILWSVTKLEEHSSIANLLLFAVFVAALITSHNLSAAIFLPIIFLWIILLFLKKRRQRFLWFSFFSFALGLVLSSFYLLPMVLEKNLVHVDTTTYGYFGYTEHFKGFRKLLLERSWGYGSSIREVPGGEKEKISFQIGWIHLLGWVLALVTTGILWKKQKWVARLILVLTLVISFSIFMVNPRSEFIWKTIEPLKFLQFPWRFLFLVIFFVSFLSGSIFLVLQKRMARWLWVSLAVLVVVFNFAYFRPEKFLQVSDEELLRGENWDRQIKRSILDYLPIYAKEPPAELAKERYKILTGDSRIYDFKEGTNWISFKTETKIHTIIRLSQYYFPNWKIFVDGKEIKFDYKNNTLGLMTFILGEGNHTVEARLYNTTVRSISNSVTLVGASMMLLLFIVQSEKARKWITYYRKRVN